MASLDFDPLNLLKQELEDESVETQLKAAQNVPLISQVIGPGRTCSELLPLLDGYCFPVEVKAASSAEAYSNTDALNAKEEVLTEIAKQLNRQFVELCGGPQQTLQAVFPLLEKLAMVEETVVRGAAVVAIGDLFQVINVDDVRQPGLDLIKRLAADDWFTSKISASGLTPELYSVLAVPEEKTMEAQEILKIHRSLCNDEMPMVKAEAYRGLVRLMDSLDDMMIIEFVTPLLAQLCRELTEDMRQTIVDVILKIGERSQEEKCQETVCEYATKCVEDESWRVRKHLSAHVPDFCGAMTVNRVSTVLIPLYLRLLKDTEAQVRKQSLSCLTSVLERTNAEEVANRLADGVLQELADDPVAEVREALADQVTSVGKALDPESCGVRLLPVIKKLASDEHPMARLNLCANLRDFSDILGIDVFEREILTLLSEMTVDQKWRVRNSIIINIAHIGVAMGKERFQQSRLKDILMASLKDPAAKVRTTAAEQIHNLLEEFGFPWMHDNIFPDLIGVHDSSGNYLHRMIPLKAIELMIPSLSAEQLKEEFLTILTRSLNDDIANVKFTACRVLGKVIPRLDAGDREQFKSDLSRLINDTDPDVQYYAKIALDAC